MVEGSEGCALAFGEEGQVDGCAAGEEEGGGIHRGRSLVP